MAPRHRQRCSVFPAYAGMDRGVAILSVLEEPLNVNLDHHDSD